MTVLCITNNLAIRIQRRQLRKPRLPLHIAILVGGAAADHQPVVQRAGGIGFYQRNWGYWKMRWDGGYRKSNCLPTMADSPTNHNPVKENDCTSATLSLE